MTLFKFNIFADIKMIIFKSMHQQKIKPPLIFTKFIKECQQHHCIFLLIAACFNHLFQVGLSIKFYF